ncbi:uncharacterized protein LOC117099906 [Anneissia japonica]|uniref:uncharacterized protein LOC117099906 n=1 Tax=Anneissia japonica TaxID=1529436 RepID=UPI0014254B4C|nr:uncharacterized protein LOC117099906 [Anneissia japonica]
MVLLNLKFMKLCLRSRSFYNQVSNFSLWRLCLSSPRQPRRTQAVAVAVAPAVVGQDKPSFWGLAGLGLGASLTECHLVETNSLVCTSEQIADNNINKMLYKYEKTFKGGWWNRPTTRIGHNHLNNALLQHILNNTSNSILTRNSCVSAYHYVCVRNYASRKKRQVNKQPDTYNESDEEDSDDSEYFDTDDDNEDVDALPKGWKDLVQVVPSLRLDTVLSAGLGIARKKVEDAFLSNKLRVNNEKISKKSKMVKAGDVLDIIRDGEDKKDGTVMRVIVLKIATEKTSKDRIRVKLRRWKKLDLKNAPANS